MSRQKSTSCFTFTVNNYSEEDVALLQAVEVKYIVYGFEVGASGTPHIQGYFVLKKDKTCSAAKKYIGINELHIEPAIADSKWNLNYCSKGSQSKEEWDSLNVAGPNYGTDASVVERGTRPLTPRERSAKGGAATSAIWADAKQKAKKGLIGKYWKEINICPCDLPCPCDYDQKCPNCLEGCCF